MANEKLQIDITAKDDASKVIDPLTKKVDKLEKSKPTVKVGADTKSANDDVDSFAKKLEKLGAEDQVVLLSLKAAGAQSELSQIATDIATLDASDPTVEIKLERYAEVAGDLDQLQAKIKSIADTPIDKGGLGGGLGNVKTKLEGMRGEADNSRSVLANMVGNSTQDLGELGGVAGTAGMAIGQLAEYATEGNISLQGLASVAGPMALVGVAVFGITQLMATFKKQAAEAAKIKAFNVENAKTFATAAQEGTDAVTAYVDAAKKIGTVQVAPNIEEQSAAFDQVGKALFDAHTQGIVPFTKGIQDVGPLLIEAGSSAKDFYAATGAGGDKLDDFVTKVKQSGISVDDQAKLLAAAKYQVDQYATGAQVAADNNALFGDSVKKIGEAQRRATESARLEGQAQQYLAEQAQDAATAHIELENAIAASAAVLAQQASNEQEYADRIDGVNAALQDQVDALNESADALNEQSDAYGSAADKQLAYNDSLKDFAEKAKDSKASTEDVRDAAIDAAKAHADLYTSLTEASGAAATSTGKLDAQNQSLLESAKTAKGPAKQAILDYIGALNDIPPETKTDIAAAVKAGDLDEAKRLLDEASANRKLTITADAKTAAADAAIQAIVDKKRTAFIQLTPRGTDILQYASGGKVGSGGGIAGEHHKKEIALLPDGTATMIDGPTWVQPGTTVIGEQDTAKAMQGGKPVELFAAGTQNVTHITTPAASQAVAVTASVEDAAAAALKAQDRLKANAYELGRISRDEYLAYLNERMQGTEDLSDDQVAYYRLIKGLQADAAKDAADAAAKQKKVSDDAAEAAKKAIEDDAKRIKDIYEQAQKAKALFDAQSAEGDDAAAARDAQAKILRLNADPKASDEDRASAGQADLSAQKRLADDVWRTVTAGAANAGLDVGSVEWDRNVRSALENAIAAYGDQGLDTTARALQNYLSGVPALAAGGIVKARPGGTLALLGEAGRDEAVVPLGSGMGGDTYNLKVEVHTPTGRLTPREEDILTNAVERSLRRSGRSLASR